MRLGLEVFNEFVHLVSADMKTSHGEPATICCSSVLDEPEFTTKLQLYCLSKAWVILAITLVRLEAAKTVSVTGVGVAVGVVMFGVYVGASVGVMVGVGAAVAVAVGDVVTIGVLVGAKVAVGDGDVVGVGDGDAGGFVLALKVPLFAK